MRSRKLSISLPKNLCQFVIDYQLEHHYHSRSEVIAKALCLLQQAQLEASYLEANQELDQDWDETAGDGLNDDEAW
jgi:antitoxin ParD1/3/4